MNPTFDEAFRYHENDIHELAEDVTVQKKLKNISDFASPRFLMGLKKKQRMREYWLSRVRKDFTSLDKEKVDEEAISKEDEPIIKLAPMNKNKLI